MLVGMYKIDRKGVTQSLIHGMVSGQDDARQGFHFGVELFVLELFIAVYFCLKKESAMNL